MICNKKHRFDKDFDLLPEAQDDRNGGRHICAGCAYELGQSDGATGRPPRTDLSGLTESQAGSVRHKDAYQAYLQGYAKGRREGFK